ncbi:serine kinase [Tyzzerella sp. An114]|uniref:HPr family phosphocarrier protein n=1 Tax=Tyzzerella sp. An114 TaxID=1965545 RepID=UPI000B44B74D|nr:HPr family phosphocarrier protein [Tyzzerella sp. An114]OUQ56823.1 serine kinase [Tyzzerella sp. An114]
MEKTICLKTVSDVKKFVNIVSKCDYDIDLIKDRYVIDAKSIIGIFSLDLTQPIKMVVNSKDCSDLIDKLKDFLYE